MLDGVQDDVCAGQGSVWTAFDLRKSCVRQIEEQRCCTITQSSIAARRYLFRVGPRYGRRACSVNHLRWLRMVWVDIRVLLRPGFPQQFLWIVSTDPIDIWGEYDTSLAVQFLEVAHYVDGSRWLQFLCSKPTVLFMSTMVRPLASYSLLNWSVSAVSSLHVITDVEMRCLIKPVKQKCPILSQFYEGYVIVVWRFQYGQERRQWE